MTDRQRSRRLHVIARRARFLEQSGELDPDALADLADHKRRVSQVGASWVARSRGQHCITPFWRGRW